MLNLAEGADKESIKEKRKFYLYSLTSLRETQAIIDILGKQDLAIKSDRLGGMVYKLVKNCL